MPQENLAQKYFRLLAKAKSLGPLTDSLIELVDLAMELLQEDNQPDALFVLSELKECLNMARPVIDQTEETIRNQMEITILGKENLELSWLLALSRGNGADTERTEKIISSMNEFFSAGIAYLDPDTS